MIAAVDLKQTARREQNKIVIIVFNKRAEKRLDDEECRKHKL